MCHICKEEAEAFADNDAPAPPAQTQYAFPSTKASDLPQHKLLMAYVPGEYELKARTILFNYIKERLEKTDTHVTFSIDEVYVVWFSKTLQNWKAMLSTTLPDGMYYELTYDGDKKCTYLDAYKKWDNVVVAD